MTIFLAYGQGNPGNIAENDLNEFDIASYCYGAEYSSASGLGNQSVLPTKQYNSESRFGFIGPSAGQKNYTKQQFVYITSRYYVQIGPYGDPDGCEFKRYIYHVRSDDSFAREEVDEKEFARVKTQLEPGRRTFAQLNPGKIFGMPELGPADSIGDCLFPIYWYRLGDEDYAVFSIVRDSAGVVGYVIPHYERGFSGKPSTCLAWGERHLTNSSIISSNIKYFPIGSDRIFIETAEFKGFTLKAGADFECFVGQDIFALHVLTKKRFFDSEMRPILERSFSEKKQLSISENKSKVLSFVQSVSLSQEFAALVTRFSVDKGCK